jgi:hypothetical protein
MATQLRGLALMTEDLQPRITVDSTINKSRFTIDWGAKPASTIGWGARLACMIGWETESMKSQMIDWKKWPILWSLMRISCAKLLNVDAHYNWMMKDQAKHVRRPIHNGVQMASPYPRREESSAYVS